MPAVRERRAEDRFEYGGSRLFLGKGEIMEDFSDIMNLCKLNLMEENIENSIVIDPVERKAVLGIIARKKREKTIKIMRNTPPIRDEVMKRHVEENTKDGIYPWTDASPIFEDE